MADFIIPIEPKVPLAIFNIELSGETFTLKIQYNKREDSWFFDILNADSLEPIRTGVKIVVDQSLLNTLRDLSIRPKGQFIAINNVSSKKDPAFEDLGNNIKLLYSEFS